MPIADCARLTQHDSDDSLGTLDVVFREGPFCCMQSVFLED
jgi:hypothetical protein